MGLSASQARLLSITARLTDNEFQSQQIANSKVRLADKTQEASAEYIDALNATQLMYTDYDAKGNMTQMVLTPAVMYNFSEMKNQYVLKNTSNQILVSETDANNYKASANLEEFLGKYGLIDEDMTWAQTVKYETECSIYNDKMTTYNTEKASFDVEYSAYKTELVNYKKNLAIYQDKLADYQAEYEDYQANIADVEAALTKYYGQKEAYYQRKMEHDGQLEEYNAWKDMGGPLLAEAYNAYKTLIYNPDDKSTGPCGKCYYNAKNLGSTGCYVHLIAHMLDWPADPADYTKVSTSVYQTSVSGATVKFNGYEISGSAMYQNGSTAANATELSKISQAIANENLKCDGDADFKTGEDVNPMDDPLYTKRYNPASITEKDILMSDYVYTAGGGFGDKKSLRQKLIDILFLLKNQSTVVNVYGVNTTPYKLTSDEMKQLLVSFTEGDLAGMNIEEPTDPGEFTENEPEYTGRKEPHLDMDEPVLAVDEPEPFTLAEPVPPEEPVKKIILTDQVKGQWYVNLWYAMNGSDTANLVKSYSSEEDDLESDDYSKQYFYVGLSEKRVSGPASYAVLESNLYSSSEWLQFALEQGVVTIQQAQYYDPSEDSGKVVELTSEAITWVAISHTSCSDISSESSEIAIAKAEAIYNQKTNEIQAKDKKYDSDIKKLDTEHSALQTEYDSVKSVIEKNVERSFKAFS